MCVCKVCRMLWLTLVFTTHQDLMKPKCLGCFLSCILVQPDHCRPHEVTNTTQPMRERTSPTHLMHNTSLHFPNAHRQAHTRRTHTHRHRQPMNMKCLQTQTHTHTHTPNTPWLQTHKPYIILLTLFNYIQNTPNKRTNRHTGKKTNKSGSRGLKMEKILDGRWTGNVWEMRVSSSQHDNNQQPMESWLSTNCVQSPVLKEGAVLLRLLLLLFTQGSDVNGWAVGEKRLGKR